VITSGTSPVTPHANFGKLSGGRGCICVKLSYPCLFLSPRPLPLCFLPPCAPAQIASFDRFLWLIAQKTCFRVIYVLSRMRTKKYISTIFRKKTRNYLFSQCKTSIGNIFAKFQTQPIVYCCIKISQITEQWAHVLKMMKSTSV